MHALTAEVLVQIESKIFFCDAKTNMRGLYLKISEKKANRERSTIIVPGRSLPWFRELFNYYATTDPTCVPCIAMSARLEVCCVNNEDQCVWRLALSARLTMQSATAGIPFKPMVLPSAEHWGVPLIKQPALSCMGLSP